MPKPQNQMRKYGCCAARARATAFALYLTWRRGLSALINKIFVLQRVDLEKAFGSALTSGPRNLRGAIVESDQAIGGET